MQITEEKTSTSSCPAPAIDLKEGEVWTDNDDKMLDVAKKRCGELYKKSPCVILYVKNVGGHIGVICGKNHLTIRFVK